MWYIVPMGGKAQQATDCSPRADPHDVTRCSSCSDDTVFQQMDARASEDSDAEEDTVRVCPSLNQKWLNIWPNTSYYFWNWNYFVHLGFQRGITKRGILFWRKISCSEISQNISPWF